MPSRSRHAGRGGTRQFDRGALLLNMRGQCLGNDDDGVYEAAGWGRGGGGGVLV